MEAQTHLKINHQLCGEIIELTEGESKVALHTTENMAADSHGLIHGGFIFSLADYAAMVAVNQPNVVLASANVKFIKPCKTGTKLVAEAAIDKTDGHKHTVFVQVWDGTEEIFYGEFLCIVPNTHVLDKKE